ncbi:hypothetical protein AOQ84DRAFT_371067 [Glonium stellatum]|uniref:BZIP domain-containing protein n=1 Tax=Glonium stellatum TaxID=574774 RepID=A0A8E2FDI2_9PEZI|nr:hypothetical protein AOQ84DRAFT_371067 [Glonium stellatum]
METSNTTWNTPQPRQGRNLTMGLSKELSDHQLNPTNNDYFHGQNHNIGEASFINDNQHKSSQTVDTSVLSFQQDLPTSPNETLETKNNKPGRVHSILNPQLDMQKREEKKTTAQTVSFPCVDPSLARSRPPLHQSITIQPPQEDSAAFTWLPAPRRYEPKHISNQRSLTIQNATRSTVSDHPTTTINTRQRSFLSPAPRSYIPKPEALQTSPLRAVTQVQADLNLRSLPTLTTPSIHSDRAPQNFELLQPERSNPNVSYSPQNRSTQMPLVQPSQSYDMASTRSGDSVPTNRACIQTQSENLPFLLQTEQNYDSPTAAVEKRSCQVRSITTQRGYEIQIPVDVEIGSKAADERRMRNAQASLRFRARKKKQQKETVSYITELERQIRKTNMEVQFYKKERDYFKQIVSQTPGGDIHFPRPLSPRHSRLSAPSSDSSSTSGSE